MRILHVHAERGFSGGENQLLATIRYLQSKGHEQTLVLNSRGRFREYADKLGISYVTSRFSSNFGLYASFGLSLHYRRIKPDLIHLACSRSHKIGCIAGAFGSKFPPKITTRRMDYHLGPAPFHRWSYGTAVAAVVVVSDVVREAVLEVGIDPDMIHLIHEGVDTARLGLLRSNGGRAAARSKLGLAAGDILGVTTASLHRRKGHDVLLESLAELRVPEGQRVVWLFGGDGPERELLTEQAKSLPAQVEVRIPGEIDYVDDALAAADMFCLPSRLEGLGVALLEALSTGVPCIAAEVGGMTEVLISGESGIHVQPEDVSALAAAIQSLIDDPDMAARLGARGRERAVDHFDIDIMGRKTEELYEQIAARGS